MRDNNLTYDFEKFIQRPDAYTRFVTGTMGWNWEDEFQILCLKKGLTCEKIALGERHDYLVNNYKVQCKFSADKKKVDIRNKDKTTERRYRKGDFDFLAIKVASVGILIIPEGELVSDKKPGLLHSSIHVEDYFEFFDNWSLLCHSNHVLPVQQETESELLNAKAVALSFPPLITGYGWDAKQRMGETLNMSLVVNGDGRITRESHVSPHPILYRETDSSL